MRKTAILFTAVFMLTVASPSSPKKFTQTDSRCENDRLMWAGQELAKLESIKPGMTRKQLLAVLTIEGGLSTPLRRTYVSPDCPYFKVDVEFNAVGRPDRDKDGRVTAVEGDQDVIVKVSRPYMAGAVTD